MRATADESAASTLRSVPFCSKSIGGLPLPGWSSFYLRRLSATVDRLAWLAIRCSPAGSIGERRMERETGIEPATNSLEGCDSTTELLPPSRSPTHRSASAAPRTSAGKSPLAARLHQCPVLAHGARLATATDRTPLRGPSSEPSSHPPARGALRRTTFAWPVNRSWRACWQARAKVGGEGRVRTSVATWAADLQSAAIDRSATSP